jgi:membrane protein
MPHSARTFPQTNPSEALFANVITQPGPVARTFWMLRRVFIAAYEDNCFGIAKGAAYSFLLSLFPILTTLTLILIHVRAQAVVHVIATFIMQVVPPGTEELILTRLRERGGKPGTLPIVAMAVSLWAGSGAMMSLMEGFQAAYRIPSGRPFLKQRGMAILLVLIAALPAVGASSLIIFGDRGEAALIRWIGSPRVSEISAPVQFLWRLARYGLAFCTTTFVTGLLYYFGPNHRPELERVKGAMGSRFMRVWPGAILATVLWLVATAAFAWYVAHIANYSFFYGSLGTVIVLLVWLYLIACIALLGCEFNAESERIDALPSLY